MKRLVRGVGINDADYAVMKAINGKRVMCPYYMSWTSMLQRCYSKEYSFSSSIVCQEWLTFSNFKRWAEQYQIEGRQLSKDLINGPTQLYSSENCVFISKSITYIFNTCESTRGSYPLGVSASGNGFRSRCFVKNVITSIGSYPCIDTAHKAWQLFKAEIIEEASYTQDDERVVAALLKAAKKLRYEHDNDIETTSYF